MSTSLRPTTSEQRDPDPLIWASPWRWPVSAALLIHLLAVFMPPFTFATSSGPGMASPAAVPVMRALQPYVDAAFLNHGYFFFAPNPGPSHLIRYRVEFEDGRPAVQGEFPNLREQQPRLLYHRHFMLSEQLHAGFTPAEPPPGLNGVELQDWQARRRRYESTWKSFERHLLAKHDGDRVEMRRVEHRGADINEILRGMPLNAPGTYEVLLEKRLPDSMRPGARFDGPPSGPLPAPAGPPGGFLPRGPYQGPLRGDVLPGPDSAESLGPPRGPLVEESLPAVPEGVQR